MMPTAPWEIQHVDLAQGLPNIGAVRAKALRLIFRLDDIVLGAVNLLPGELPMSAAEIASAAAEEIGSTVAQLLTFGLEGEARARLPGEATRRPTYQQSRMPQNGVVPALRQLIAARRKRAVQCSVSIVICTRYRAELLAACLSACAPELAGGREIIVVDNGPDEATRSLVAEFSGVRYIEEARPGLSRARNAGVRAATGDVIAFIDDDVRPELGWVDALLIALADPQTAIATGLVLPAELDHQAQIDFEFGLGFGGMGFVPLRFDDRYFRAHKNRGVPVWTIGAGANMAVRRTLFSQIGLFDEDIGAGTPAPCSEDSEFWYRALAAGHTIKYEPFSVVRHVHRSGSKAIRDHARDYMDGHVAALFVQYRKHGHLGNIHRALLKMPVAYMFRFLRKIILVNASHSDALFWHMIQGYLRGLRHAPLAVKGSSGQTFAGRLSRTRRQRQRAAPIFDEDRC